MSIESETLNVAKPRTSRRRKLSAAAGVAALVCAGTVVAASPASADSACGTYHNWEECVSFSGGYISATAYNGYSTAEVETVWVNSYSVSGIDIPSGGSATVSYYFGYGPVHVCAGIDSVQIICANL